MGYLGLVLKHHAPGVQLPPATEPEPISRRSILIAVVGIIVGVIILEFLQFAVFDSSLMPSSVIYGLPVFLTICSYPFAVHAAWRLRWQRAWRIAVIVLITLAALGLVGTFGSTWIITHMAL